MDEIERNASTPGPVRRSSRPCLRLAMVAAAWLLVAGGSAPAEDDDSTAAPRSALALQLEMAASERFYLEIDAPGGVMRLKLNGVSLHAYPLLALERGTPRVAFFTLGSSAGVSEGVHPVGRIDPPRPEIRLEIQPPDPNAPDSTLPVFEPPPSIEEMSVPWSYAIRFEDGLTLAVTSPRESAAGGIQGMAGALRDKIAECREALAVRRPHLRIVLERADAQHLYRSLPPDTNCLVLAP